MGYPFAAQQQAETDYIIARFNAALKIACDYYLLPQQAVLVYMALDCTHTVIDRNDDSDTKVRYGGAETLDDRVKHWVLKLLYPDAITLQRSPLHIQISIPLATMPKKAPLGLWNRVQALRDSGTGYDTDCIPLVSKQNELVTSSLWRKYNLLGEELPSNRRERNRVKTNLTRYSDDWRGKYPEPDDDDDDDDNHQFRAAFLAEMAPQHAQLIASP